MLEKKKKKKVLQDNLVNTEPDLRIMLFGSSSSLMVRQRGMSFTVYKSEVVP